jgi:Icc-related predicted phosphoesterase
MLLKRLKTTKFISKMGARQSTTNVSNRKVLGVWESGQEPIKAEGATRFVCISDTHEQHDMIKIPDGDVLIHGGDITSTGELKSIQDFSTWLGQLPHKHKVVIAGNHDVTFEPEFYKKHWKRYHDHPFGTDGSIVKEALTNCHYLEDQEIVINDIRIWGSPWQPHFCSWAFNLPRGEELKKKWDLIPEGIDILITHGPPLGQGDLCYDARRVGCEDLLDRIRVIKPKIHVFGHIHEGRGITHYDDIYFINACSVDFSYSPIHKAIIFDII